MLFSRFSRLVGVRYLTAKKGSKVLSVISAICVGGVTVGVFAMVVILSVMGGFENEMRKRLFSADTHIRIEGEEGYFDRNEQNLQLIKESDPRIRLVVPVLQTETIIKSGKRVAGAVLKGVAQEGWDRQSSFVTEWIPTQLERPGVAGLLLGQEIAFELGVVTGDELTVVSPIESEGPMGLAPRMKKFIVQGIYRSGSPDQEMHVVIAQMKDVESFLRVRNQLSAVEVQLDQLESAPAIKNLLSQKVSSGLTVRTWQDLNSHLMYALSLERAAMFCMLAFIVMVAAFNILSVLTMTVMEKKRSVSILRAIGATRGQIRSVFLWQSLAVAMVGSGLGASAGVGVCLLLKKYPIIELPDYYYDRSLPVLIQPSLVALIVLITFIIVVLGALYPARKASAVTPLQGIKAGN